MFEYTIGYLSPSGSRGIPDRWDERKVRVKNPLQVGDHLLFEDTDVLKSKTHYDTSGERRNGYDFEVTHIIHHSRRKETLVVVEEFNVPSDNKSLAFNDLCEALEDQ